jgi:hypothetical protein
MAVFLETSAFLRLLFREQGAKDVQSRLAKAGTVVASRLLRIEAERAVLRASLDSPLFAKSLPVIQHEMRSALAAITFLEITREACDLAGTLAPDSRLRSLDAIHLATYRTLKAIQPDLEMLTFDERILRELA